MNNKDGASALPGTGLSPSVEPASGLAGSAASIPDADRDPLPFLGERHRRLPLWAQRQISDLRSAEINAEGSAYITGLLREATKRVTGGNMTFADDDLALLEELATRACDAGLTTDLSPSMQRDIAQAIEARSGETGTGSIRQDESAVRQDAPNTDGELARTKSEAGE